MKILQIIVKDDSTYIFTENPEKDVVDIQNHNPYTDITLELQNCLAYCMEVNGRPDCKNCGLDSDMIKHIEYLVSQACVKGERNRLIEMAREEGRQIGRNEILKEWRDSLNK